MRSREDAPVCLRALEPGLLSGNRRRTWEERVEHEEAGSLVRAEASADTVREGGCGRGRGGGGRPTSLPGEGWAGRWFWPGGLIAISLEVLSPLLSAPPPPASPPFGIFCHSGFKRVETRGLVARVARLWSQIYRFESRRHHISSCDRIQVG